MSTEVPEMNIEVEQGLDADGDPNSCIFSCLGWDLIDGLLKMWKVRRNGGQVFECIVIPVSAITALYFSAESDIPGGEGHFYQGGMK
jgi:hypothetical protein